MMKTIKEAATAYTNACCFPKNKDDFRIQIHRAYLRGVEYAQRWISVDEELPEDVTETIKEGNYTYTVTPVLVKTSNGRYATAKRRMFLDHGWNWKGSGTFNNSVTHWRHIELE
jgi:hypothetical protein